MGLIAATAKRPHPILPRRAFPRRNDEKRRSHPALAPREGPRSGGDGTNGALLRSSCRQSLRRAPPRLFFRSELWIALLGRSIEEGIVGIGPNVEAALRAFDAQYLAGLRSPIAVVKDLGALDQRLKEFGAARRRGRSDKSDLNSAAEVSHSTWLA
jgi:hypothetical protein